jgi:hypothetical protein
MVLCRRSHILSSLVAVAACARSRPAAAAAARRAAERRLLHDCRHDDHAERSGQRGPILPLHALPRRADIPRPP